MTLKDDMKAYKARWENVETYIAQERRLASLTLRWRQLNAIFGMAKGLNLLRENPGELGVIKRWAKLKEQASNQPPKT
jgi:hypothetical protein